MEKKTIWGAIFLNSALTVALAIYTIVAIVLGFAKKPEERTVALALRVDDEYVFEEGDITFEGLGDIMEQVGDKYIAKNPGEFTCVVEKKEDYKITYNVTVYGYGHGTADHPYNITSVNHLFDLKQDEANVTIYDQLDKVYSLRADIDLEGMNWEPIGQLLGDYESQIVKNEDDTYTKIGLSTEERLKYMFTGEFIGNDHTINNLFIQVTADNFWNYAVPNFVVGSDKTTISVSEVYMYVGFFGYARDAKISGLKFNNAEIIVASELTSGEFVTTISELDGQALLIKNSISEEEGAFLYASSGVLVGGMRNTIVGSAEDGVVVENSKLTAGNASSYNGIGLLAGELTLCDIQNITIRNAQMTATSPVTMAGGVVGNVWRLYNQSGYFVADDLAEDGSEKETVIANVLMEKVDIVGNAHGNSAVAGVAAIFEGSTLKDVTVNELSISVDDTNTDGISSVIAGAVGRLSSFYTKTGTEITVSSLENVSVNGSINAIDSDNTAFNAAGLVFYSNEGSIVKDSSFNGSITGKNVAGAVLANWGSLTYTDLFAGNAVSAEIYVYQSGAGLVYNNYGSVSGSELSKTKVNVKITEASMIIIPASFEHDDFIIAGLVSNLVGGVVENFEVTSQLIDPINGAGAIGFVGGIERVTINAPYKTNDPMQPTTNVYSYNVSTDFSGAVVTNISTDVEIRTVVERKNASTKRAAGVIALVKDNSVISEISSKGNINDYAADNDLVSGYIVAGIIGEVNGKKIEISDASTEMSVKANVSIFQLSSKDVSFVAGAIGVVTQTGSEAGDEIKLNAFTVKSSDSIKAIKNNLGYAQNGYPNPYEINTALASVAGLIARVQGLSTIKVSISNFILENYEVSAYNIASAGFGIVTNATIENVEINATKVAGAVVSGMVGSVQDSTLKKTGVELLACEVYTHGEKQRFAGYASDVKGTVLVENAYVIIPTDKTNFSSEIYVNTILAALAIQDNSSSATYKNVVCYVNVKNATAEVGLVQGITGESTSSYENVKKLSENTEAASMPEGAQALTEDQMKDAANFNGFDFSAIWEIKEEGKCPTFIESAE